MKGYNIIFEFSGSDERYLFFELENGLAVEMLAGTVMSILCGS